MTKTSRKGSKDIKVFDVDGTVVEFAKVDPDRFDFGRAPDGTPGSLKHRTKHEVRVGGELVGFVFRPNGIGYPYDARNLLEDYDPAVGHPRLNSREDKHESLDRLAPLFVGWVAADEAPSAARLDVLRAEHEAEKVRKKHLEDERSAAWERERQERERTVEKERSETLEALQGIVERFHGQMTNFEAEALGRAMKKFTK